MFWLEKFTCSFRAAVCILVGNLFRLQKIKLPRSFGSEPILERLVAFAILSHFDCIFARNQSNRTILDPPNKPGWIINAYQIKQYGMVQNSPKPSHHIATDENRKIRNRRSCLRVWKGIFGIRDLTKIRCGNRENDKYVDGIRDLTVPREAGLAKNWLRDAGFMFACLLGMPETVTTHRF